MVTGANASSSIDFALTWVAARRGIVLAVLALRRAGAPANAVRATAFFKLPPERVVELGVQVEM